jgi:hypothetical protein
MRLPRRAATLPLPLLAAACALPLDEAAHFRARLPALAGQPVALLERELGPPAGDPVSMGSPRSWGELVLGFGAPGGGCAIDAVVDSSDTIRSVTMKGDDYVCGGMLSKLHREAPRYADPTRAARERDDGRRRAEKLVRARQTLNEARRPKHSSHRIR